MGLFQRKKDKVQAELSPSPPEFALSEPVGEERAACMNRLETILGTPPSKGIMLKLYLESFKNLNKTFGYEYCEELPSQITGYLTELVEDNIYRYISVEFIIVLEQFSESQVSGLADEILEHFGNVRRVRDVGCLCSTQIDLHSHPGHATAVDELIKHLDLAVTSTAECGPNQISVYDSSMHTRFMHRQATAIYLQTALEEHGLGVRYRPTYNLKEGRFIRADSYMGVFIQGTGLVGADESLLIAEDSGQIHATGYHALDHAGQCITDLITSGKEFDSICIPISPILLVQEDFIDQVRLVIEKYDIPECKLAFKIDDSALPSIYLNIDITIQELYDMGAELVMNSFGSDCAPVVNILNLPIHTVKLERIFVWQLEVNPKSAPITGGLIQIAKRLSIHIIAEGVETENQPNALNSYSCEYRQGFYYAPTIELDVPKEVLGITLGGSRVAVEEEKMKMKR